MKKALVLVNRHGGSADRQVAGALGRLASAGIHATLHEPDSPDHLRATIERDGAAADMIVIGGGDGTLSGALPAVLAVDRPLGVLPMGTANDFARALGVPLDLEGAADVIAAAAAAGRERRVDIGLLGERPFINVATVGFAADVARFHSGARKRRLKLLSYPLSWIDAYRRHRPFRATVVCDERRMRIRCTQLAIGAGRSYGGGLTIDAEAQVDDGWLHVYYLKPLSVWGWIWLLPALKFGTLRHRREATALRARRLEVSTRKPRPVNVDGELDGRTPVEVRIKPRALRVLAPEGAAGAPQTEVRESDR